MPGIPEYRMACNDDWCGEWQAVACRPAGKRGAWLGLMGKGGVARCLKIRIGSAERQRE